MRLLSVNRLYTIRPGLIIVISMVISVALHSGSHDMRWEHIGVSVNVIPPQRDPVLITVTAKYISGIFTTHSIYAMR